MTRIIPIRDLKDTGKISKLCHEIDEPIFITKNGYDDMVIMSSEVFRKLSLSDEQYKKAGLYSLAEQPVPYIAGNSKYTIPKIKQILTPILKEYNVNRAVLFGSYAKGTDHAKSDIDLIVDSGLRGLAFFGLLEDIVSKFTIPVDLIEQYQIKKGSQMEKEIKETGIIIYEQ